MKIGDEVFIHGYVDEIRKDTVIIRNDGGYFGTVKSEITKLPEPKKRWIPCGERLPKESNFYMVTNEYDEVEIIWFAHKDDYDIDKSEWRETEDKIIAWMPLPEPYMEDMKGKE